MSKLLTKEQFNAAVFARDKHACVLCGAPGVDAHHLLERKLFQGDEEKGGFFLDNGATVCSSCHIACERTDISVEQIMAAAKITERVLPSHLETDQVFDKWGNPILPSGQRLRGEMFWTEQVQKVLADKMHLFTHWVKYPRTFHLPWSPGLTADDKVLRSLAGFVGKRCIGTKKVDGENSSLYSDHIHARSLDSKHHASRDWLKQFWGGIRHEIPDFWRVCGENMFAKHSIAYDDLPSYFLGFSVWDERNVCLPWDETLEWFALLGITPVEVIFDGIFDEKAVRALEEQLDPERDEGYVLRVADAIPYPEFRNMVGKFVRRGHVQTDRHWMFDEIQKNQLRAG